MDEFILYPKPNGFCHWCGIKLTNKNSAHCSLACKAQTKASSPYKYPCESRSPYFGVWKMMIERCYNPKNKSYERYGARGIIVCKQWKSSFRSFESWAIAQPKKPEATLDRKNNLGPYSPNNCRYATPTQQNRNRRNNTIITAFGESKTAPEWAEDSRCKVTASTIGKRVRNGVNAEYAITSPNFKPARINAFGVSKTLIEWANDPRCAVNVACLKERIRKGKGGEPEAAISAPAREPIQILAFGKSKTMTDWIKDPRCTVKLAALARRLRTGMLPEKAITRPEYCATKGVLLTIFGETKSVSAWSRDSRCKTELWRIRTRLKQGINPKTAVTTKLLPWERNNQR